MDHFVCIKNDGYPASLRVGKMYDAEIVDEKGLIRVIDESGEDYLYPRDFFIILEDALASIYKPTPKLKLFRRKIQFGWQRWRMGWDDSETWNLDTTLAKFIAPRLKRFKELNNGIPHDFTEETWDEALDKMIFALDKCAKKDEDEESGLYWDKETYAQIDEGLELFGKHFRDLWW